MKTNVNKSSVISRIENSVRCVTLSQAPVDYPYLYIITDHSKQGRGRISYKYFNHIREAENYLFEHYVSLIIPIDRCLNEGSHVFLY